MKVGLKFCCQLRLEAAARFFEPGFRSRHVSEHYVQPLRSQDQESEQEDEQDFCAKTHASPPVLSLARGQCVCGCAVRGLVLFHRGLEAADAFSDSLAEFGKLLRSEHKQSNSEDNQQVHRLKQSFKHKSSLGWAMSASTQSGEW
jgi:hypothetical protein